jgi:hypothetical protein
MKKKLFIFISIFLFILILTVSGCSSEPIYTAEEWEEIQREEEQKEEAEKKQEQIADFRDRVSKHFDYVMSYWEIYDKYGETISDLIDKFNNETDNIDKKATYAELLVEKYEKYYEDYSKIKTPSFLKEAYSYRLEYLAKTKLQFKEFADKVNYEKYNEPDNWDEIQSEAQLLDSKYWNEIDIIEDSFNKEANELGLQEPFRE